MNHLAHWNTSLLHAINFLYCNQLNHGEFETKVSPESSMTKSKSCPASSPYVTTFILYSISSIRGDLKVDDMIKKSLDFLLNTMEEHSTWRFYSKNNSKIIYMNGLFRRIDMRLAPDLDDTACASHALKLNNIDFSDNQALFYESMATEGVFPTWLLIRESLLEEQDNVPLYNNICCGVNANILLYLGDSSKTKDTSDYINNVIVCGKEAQSCDYFPNSFAFYYLVSRAYASGAYSLEPSRNNIAEKILRSLNTSQYPSDIFSIILAIASLLNFGKFTHELTEWIEIIIDTQSADGSWPTKSFFVDTTNHYGSQELTTAIAIEAIAKASLLMSS